MELTDIAREKRREYARTYRAKHKEEIAAYRKKWNAEHPDKQKEYVINYWNRKAGGGYDGKEN